ncbi:toprim domain-containing protein [uncultured Spongiibacter sp.]|uniref:toprim domain-containing protein n=1 Tax=uncultured Spongiibacter sp. TaxID=870896 RepID=UPI00259392D5|nr:toprim domain-containing protein [uncultured Spongiibacter sp.]
MHSSAISFYDAICTAGLTPPDRIFPGKWHRFPGAGKGPANRSGWCLLFDDEQGGCFGDWSTGLRQDWFRDSSCVYSRHRQSADSNELRAARLQAEVSRQAQYENAANRARWIWDSSSGAPAGHSYLLLKGINPHNARVYNGLLVLPVTNFHGAITSLQFIAPNGQKRLLSGGRKQGCFIAVAGDEENVEKIVICEGWATGCTLAEHEPAALVLAAIDAGNLESVAVSARCHWPSAEIIIAGDDDRLTPGNPGATKAKAAAIAADALLALPQWPENAPAELTDFNDLALWQTGGDA